MHSILGAVLNNYMFAQFVESSETVNIYKCIYMFSIFIIYMYIAVSIILYLQKKPFDPAIKMREFLYLMKVWSSILHINLNNWNKKEIINRVLWFKQYTVIFYNFCFRIWSWLIMTWLPRPSLIFCQRTTPMWRMGRDVVTWN